MVRYHFEDLSITVYSKYDSIKKLRQLLVVNQTPDDNQHKRRKPRRNQNRKQHSLLHSYIYLIPQRFQYMLYH